MIKVSIAKLPSGLKEFFVEEGATVDSLLRTAEMSSLGYSITVDGSAGNQNTPLQNGATVILARSAKGNKVEL